MNKSLKAEWHKRGRRAAVRLIVAEIHVKRAAALVVLRAAEAAAKVERRHRVDRSVGVAVVVHKRGRAENIEARRAADIFGRVVRVVAGLVRRRLLLLRERRWLRDLLLGGRRWRRL